MKVYAHHVILYQWASYWQFLQVIMHTHTCQLVDLLAIDKHSSIYIVNLHVVIDLLIPINFLSFTPDAEEAYCRAIIPCMNSLFSKFVTVLNVLQFLQVGFLTGYHL